MMVFGFDGSIVKGIIHHWFFAHLKLNLLKTYLIE